MTFNPDKRVVECEVKYEDGENKFIQRLALEYYF